MNKYEIVWNNGTQEIVEGSTFLLAMTQAGYGYFGYNNLKMWKQLPIDYE